MSKGWYVKVDIPVHFNIDCNVGVVADCERQAESMARDIVKKELMTEFPWDFEIGALHGTRGCETFGWDDDYISCTATRDPDFDPESRDPQTLMEVAQCLNEAFYGLDCLHPLYDYRATHGSAEVRDRINAIALLCEQTYQAVRKMYGFDGPFDFDFCPQFLYHCVDDDFEPRSTDPGVMAILWKRS